VHCDKNAGIPRWGGSSYEGYGKGGLLGRGRKIDLEWCCTKRSKHTVKGGQERVSQWVGLSSSQGVAAKGNNFGRGGKRTGLGKEGGGEGEEERGMASEVVEI